MSIKKVFKSYVPSVNYVTQKGRTCVFVEGKFLTDHVEEIAELNDVCNSKSNPHIYIDPDESEVDTTVQERVSKAAQAAALAELEKINKEKEAAGQVNANGVTQAPQAGVAPVGTVGMSAAKLLGVTSSANVAGMAAASNQK